MSCRQSLVRCAPQEKGTINNISSSCPLCPPAHGIITRDEHWTLVLNENQATLGRVYFALNRHETDVTAMTTDEVSSLWKLAAQTKRVLETLFAPDHYNYLFHMNLTPHVHMHIYPRYKAPREFAGQRFTDTRYGDHYDPQQSQLIDPETEQALLTAFRVAMSHAEGKP